MTEVEQNEKLGWGRERRPLTVADIARRRAELKTLYSVLDAEESILQVLPFLLLIFVLNFYCFPSECGTETFPLSILAEKGIKAGSGGLETSCMSSTAER